MSRPRMNVGMSMTLCGKRRPSRAPSQAIQLKRMYPKPLPSDADCLLLFKRGVKPAIRDRMEFLPDTLLPKSFVPYMEYADKMERELLHSAHRKNLGFGRVGNVDIPVPMHLVDRTQMEIRHNACWDIASNRVTVKNGAGKEAFIFTRPSRTVNYEGIDEIGLNLLSFRKANKILSKLRKRRPLASAPAESRNTNLSALSPAPKLHGRARTLARYATEKGRPPPEKPRPPDVDEGMTPLVYIVSPSTEARQQ
ncbi:hypothetical protein LTR93_011171 [Exophiala xenobiotica]|nr:hypothetical protein LTR93_011171 [Exophiala xenobiotica]